MNTYEIQKTVSRDKCLNKCFLGVFPSDKLPTIYTKPACFIANTDPSNEPGQHWVAMFFDRYVEYFDSYGLEPPEPFARYNPEILNTYCLQNIGSVVCGEYCIYYLHKRMRGAPLQTIALNLRNRSDSDRLVGAFVDKLRVYGQPENCQHCNPKT